MPVASNHCKAQYISLGTKYKIQNTNYVLNTKYKIQNINYEIQNTPQSTIHTIRYKLQITNYVLDTKYKIQITSQSIIL